MNYRIGDTAAVQGTVRTIEAIHPAGHLRITLDVAPPKPPEPTGLGAVVEDAEGDAWVRMPAYVNNDAWAAWKGGDFSCRAFRDIDVVRVLSEGVSA